jgi:hypothetical protein
MFAATRIRIEKLERGSKNLDWKLCSPLLCRTMEVYKADESLEIAETVSAMSIVLSRYKVS